MINDRLKEKTSLSSSFRSKIISKTKSIVISIELIFICPSGLRKVGTLSLRVTMLSDTIRTAITSNNIILRNEIFLFALIIILYYGF